MTDYDGQGADAGDLGGVRGDGGAAQRRLRWLLVHVVPHDERGQGAHYEANCALKKRLVQEGRAHAALVFDGDEAVAWAQFGSPAELPNIYHRKQYDEELDLLPDYRITCIFVDKRYRRKRLSDIALQGALDLIAAAGGGVVEGYPHDNARQEVSVLYDGTRTLFERAGFEYVRSKGPLNCVMRRSVP